MRWTDWSSSDEAVLTAPGAGVRLRKLKTASLNGRLGRVLPREGRGAPADAPADGRVAVRLVGTAAQVVSVRVTCLAPAEVLAVPRRVDAPRPLPRWAGPLLRERAAESTSNEFRLLDLPLPPEAPMAIYTVCIARHATVHGLQGANVGLRAVSVAEGVSEPEARVLLDGRWAHVSASVSAQSGGAALARDEFILARAGPGAYVTEDVLIEAGAAVDTGRVAEGGARVLRCVLPEQQPAHVREDPLGGLFSGLSLRTSRNNPAMPCAFERLGEPGAPQDPELNRAVMGQRWELLVEPAARAFDREPHWSSPSAAKAAAHALVALMVPPERAQRVADEALAMCEHCGDAWTAKALRCAMSWEEALGMFRRAVDAANAALAPELQAELASMRGLSIKERERRHMREPWLVHPVRPLERAMMGVANTLRKLHRWSEAADAYMALHALDPGNYSNSSFWLNWKAHVPDVLIAAGRVDEARSYTTNPDNSECYEYNATAMHWNAAGALLDYVQNWARRGELPATVSPWPGERVAEQERPHLAGRLLRRIGRAQQPGRRGGVMRREAHHGVAGARGVLARRHVAQIHALAHDERMHDAYRPATQALWVAETRPVWDVAAPGALAMLRRVLRTLTMRHWLCGEPLLQLSASRAPGRPLPPLPPPDTAAAAAWVAAGEVFVNARFGYITLLSEAVRATHAGVELAWALLAAGADTCAGIEQRGRSPIEQWAFYAFPVTVGKHLVAASTCRHHGARRHAAHLQEAAAMAANQCNAVQLAYVLPAALDAVRATGGDVRAVGEAVMAEVLTSSVPMCLESMGGQPCQRCMGRDQPHSPAASFTRTMGAFVAAGVIDLSSPASMAALRRLAGGGPTARLVRKWEAAHAAALKRRAANACAFCGESGGKKCARCSARFCGEACIAAGWPTHKAECAARRAAKADAT